MLLAFIPTVCWWQEHLPIFVPTQQASNSCSPASPATSSCCPSGLGLRSSEITLCVQVWGKKFFYWTTFYLCLFLSFFKRVRDVFSNSAVLYIHVCAEIPLFSFKNCIIHIFIKFPHKMQGLYPQTRRAPPIHFPKKEEVMLS